VYKCSYEQVWTAVREEVRERYKKINVEQPEQGLIVTQWEWYSAAGSRKLNGTADGDAVFRIAAQIVQDDAGWVVKVNGGAQRYLQGSPKPVPADLPWVEDRIASLSVAVYERLEQYDVSVTAASQ
jgi:hypothetical protein